MDGVRFIICLFGFYGMGLFNGAINGTGENQNTAITVASVLILLALLFSFMLIFGERKK